jgi:hypothetical protein
LSIWPLIGLIRVRLRYWTVARPVIWLDSVRLRCSPTLNGSIPRLFVIHGTRPVCSRIVLWLPGLRLAWLTGTVASVALPSLCRCAVHWLRWLGSFSHRYRRLLRRRSDSDRSGLRLRSRRLDLSHLADGQRLAAIALYGFLALFKRWRRRRGRGLGYNRTLLHGGRRLMLRGSCRSQHCLFCWHDSRLAHLHLRASHLPLIHSHGIARNGLRRGERLLARRHNGARNPLVHIGHVVHGSVVVYHRGLIVVVHHCAIDGRV